MLSRTVRPIAILLSALVNPLTLPRAPGAEPDPEIGILLRFDAPPGSAFISTMERELARIMAEADLRLYWMAPEQSNGRKDFARAMVFTFHGACRAIPSPPKVARESETVDLADTAVDGDTILPYSEMNCDRLREFLSSEEPRAAGAENRLGLAMARVLAHEMYHVLLQTRVHGARGITRAAHTPSALVSQSLRFDEQEIGRLRERFRKPAKTARNMNFRKSVSSLR